MLDGSRERDALLDELLELMRSGAAAVETDNGRITNSAEEVRSFLAAELEKRLAELAEMGLLVA